MCGDSEEMEKVTPSKLTMEKIWRSRVFRLASLRSGVTTRPSPSTRFLATTSAFA